MAKLPGPFSSGSRSEVEHLRVILCVLAAAARRGAGAGDRGGVEARGHQGKAVTYVRHPLRVVGRGHAGDRRPATLHSTRVLD